MKSLRDQFFFRSCGVRNIMGTPWQRKDFAVQPAADGMYQREAGRLAARLATAGAINLSEPKFWDLKLTSGERSEALELLPTNEKNCIAVSVGTKLPVKDWGEENWEKLLTLLAGKMPEKTLVLLGAPDEWERSEKLRRAWKGPSINLSGKTSPRVSAAILERCRLFIGHDSGPMHLAGAAGIPTLGIFSWQNPPGQWFPGHESWKTIKILYPPLPGGAWNAELQMKRGVGEGILLLQPDEVFQAAMALWQANDNSTGRVLNHVPAGVVNS